MSIESRTFANFERGDDVGQLSSGLLPEMADVFEVPLSKRPTGEEIGVLVGVIGTKETLQSNIAGAKAWLTEKTGSEDAAQELAVSWVDRSGAQEPLDRSFMNPAISSEDAVSVLVTGGVANWQDRAVNYIIEMGMQNLERTRFVEYVAGNRIMDSPTEITNPNVQLFHGLNGRYPNEAEYAARVTVPKLEQAGYDVYLDAYATNDGQKIAMQHMRKISDMFAKSDRIPPIACLRAANAAVQLAGQFRNAAIDLRPEFDQDTDNPQLFIVSDTFPVARTREQLGNPQEYQNSFTAIRQIAVTAKTIAEAK